MRFQSKCSPLTGIYQKSIEKHIVLHLLLSSEDFLNWRKLYEQCYIKIELLPPTSISFH